MESESRHLKNLSSKIICIYISFLLCAGGSAKAQTEKIDSVKNVLKVSLDDSNKVKRLYFLSNLSLGAEGNDSALKYAQQAIALSLKIRFLRGIAEGHNQMGVALVGMARFKDAVRMFQVSLKVMELLGDKKGISNGYNNIGIIFFNQGNYAAAIENYSIALRIAKEMGDNVAIATANGNMGLVYYLQGNYAEALRSDFEVLRMWEDMKNKKGMLNMYNNLGNVFLDQENFSEAAKYYEKVIKLAEELQDKKGLADGYDNLANVLQEQSMVVGDSIKKVKLLLETEYYYKKSKALKEQIGDGKGLEYFFINMGGVCCQLGNFEEALTYLVSGLRLANKIEDMEGISTAYYQMGIAYRGIRKISLAEENCLKSIKIAIEIGYLDLVKDGRKLMSEIYASDGRYLEAMNYYKAYVSARDSLLNQENTKKSVQLQMKYEFDKRESATKLEQQKKDAIAYQERRKQSIIIGAVSASLFLVLVLGLVILRSLRLNQRKNRIIHAQKEAVERQKDLIEEKQKEILDSITYARRIQRSLLTSEGYIFKCLKRMNWELQ